MLDGFSSQQKWDVYHLSTTVFKVVQDFLTIHSNYRSGGRSQCQAGFGPGASLGKAKRWESSHGKAKGKIETILYMIYAFIISEMENDGISPVSFSVLFSVLSHSLVSSLWQTSNNQVLGWSTTLLPKHWGQRKIFHDRSGWWYGHASPPKMILQV